MAHKLPILKTVGDAFGMALSLPLVHSGFFFTYLFLIVFLISFLSGLFVIDDDLVSQLIWRIIWLLAMAPFAVYIHRHIILNETIPTPSRLFKSIFTKRNATFAGYAVLIAFPVYFIGFLTQLPKIGFSIWFLLLGFLQIPVAIVLMGIIIFLPFIAVDNKQTFVRCWSKTRGNILRVFLVSAMIGVVTMVVTRLVILPLETGAYSTDLSSPFAWLGLFLLATVVEAFWMISVAWGVVAVSHVFVFLSQGDEDKNATMP